MQSELFRTLLDAPLFARGTDLMPLLGVGEIAWGRPDVLDVINTVCLAGLRVLGGDVLRRRGLEISYTGDNWHSEPEDGESLGSFSARSCDRARQYITSNGRREDESLLFVLVVG